MSNTTSNSSSNSSDDSGLVFDSGDNAWMMTSTALVLMMTPALAFFYGGLVDRKNVLNQLFLSVVCMGIVMVQWVLFGFSFAFGPPISRGFGSFGYAALRFGQRLDADYSPTFPLLTYAAFQATFAIITPAIISGSIVGRMKLLPYMLFIFIWSTVCYDPMAHWVWGSNGWLRNLGTLDFAGGTVVHILSGVSGFVASLILGKRINYDRHENSAHNLPFTVLGASLLWVGWIGFNAGSATAASGLASLALVNTCAAAAAGLMTWALIDAVRGHVSVSGACAGIVIGLVAITPACGFVAPGWSILFGVIPTIVIYIVVAFKRYLRVDDTLDVAINHAIGGAMGAFMTGLFAQIENNPAGANGAFYGHPIQLWYQTAGILTAIGFSAACTAGILLPLKYTIGIRLSAEEELRGLDHIAHGEHWELTDKPKNRNTTTTTNKIQPPPPYRSQNSATSNKIAPSSRSKVRRQSRVRVQSDVTRMKPAYSRSQSQVARNNSKSQANASNLPV